MNECCIPKSSIVDLWSPIRFLLRLGSHVSSVAGALVPVGGGGTAWLVGGQI